MRTNLKDSLKGIEISGKGKIIQRNTFRYTNKNGDTVIRLHTTDIITHTLDGKTILNSGGYKSYTTKERMNSYSGYHVSQRKGVWYVYGSGNTENSIPYYDGMILPDAFLNPSESPKTESEKLIKDINNFVKKIDTFKTLPLPNSGDCWECSMFSRDNPIKCNCLLSHIEEGYIHGSLLVNALRSAGFQDSGIGIYLTTPNGFGKAQVKRSLRKYLKKSLGLPA